MANSKANGGLHQGGAANARKVIGLTDGGVTTDYNERVWEDHAVPGGLDSGLFRRLASIEKAVSGIRGVRSVLRADADCRMWADADEDVEYKSLNDCVVGRLEEGLDALLSVVEIGLEELRLSDWSAVKGCIKYCPDNLGGNGHG